MFLPFDGDSFISQSRFDAYAIRRWSLFENLRHSIKVLPFPRAEAKGKLLGGAQPQFADKESFLRVLSVATWISPKIYSLC